MASDGLEVLLQIEAVALVNITQRNQMVELGMLANLDTFGKLLWPLRLYQGQSDEVC